MKKKEKQDKDKMTQEEIRAREEDSYRDNFGKD